MRTQVIDTLRRHSMVSPGDVVMCGLSGGADSTALVHVLKSLSDELGISVCAAHLNHMLRGDEADRDENFARELCERLDIPFYSARLDAGAYAKAHGLGIEEGARKLRYEFFADAAAKSGASKIATAHNADDNLETMIFNLARGSAIGGMCGIPPTRDSIIRPLIYTERRAIIRYLLENGLSYVTDSSNLSDEFTRNRIRMVVIPVLRAINPSAAATASECAALLRDDAQYLDGEAGRIYGESVCTKEKTASVRADFFSSLPPAISGRIAELMFAAITGGTLDRRHVSDIRSAASDGAERSLPHGMSAWVSRGRLYVGRRVRRKEFPEITERSLEMNGVTAVSEAGISVRCRPADKKEEIHSLLNTFYINRDTINGNLKVRARKEGDRIKLNGRGVTKTLKKLFIESGIPCEERGLIPVIADDSGVIAVGGFGADAEHIASTYEKTIYIEIEGKRE